MAKKTSPSQNRPDPGHANAAPSGGKPATSAPTKESLTIDEALSRAHAHWNAGHADQAELLCQRVLAAWPGQADALHLLGIMAHAFNNLDLALQYLRQASQSPRVPAAYLSNFAEMCRQKGLLQEGENAARRATTLDSSLVPAWNNLGIILQESGKLEESAVCLERVVALQPENAEAHNNLGNTFKRLGQLDKAGAQYERALSLRPDYAEAYSNLAHLLNDLGQSERAEQLARKAVELNPRLGDAYLNLAEIELSRQRFGEALRWLESLLSFAPNFAGALSARARTLKHFDRLDEALNSATRAVSAAPQSADAHNTLGEIQQALNQFDLALASFDKAARLPGTVAESARINRGVLLMETGRRDEAMGVFDAVLKANPKAVSALTARADLKKFAAGDPDIAIMEELLGAQGAQSLKDRQGLHFALGKAYLDVASSDSAFKHLDEGNRLKRATFGYDSEATAGWMASIPRTFTGARLKKFKAAGNPSDMPVFVVGMPRSGTTLVEQILGSHPEVHAAGELRAIQQIVDRIGNFPASIEQLTEADFERLGTAYLEQIRPLAAGKRFVVDKMPANFLYVGFIRLILPNARIIHCRRDPVDTCLSCYSKLFNAEQAFTYDLAELGKFHLGYQQMMAHWRKNLPKGRFLEVDYEAVVEDLPGQARRLTDFLGLPWDDACLNFHEMKGPVRTASVNQVRQPVYKSSVGRWRAHAGNLKPLIEALGIEAEDAAKGSGAA